MKESMREINTWTKLVDFHLGGEMNIDMSGDFQKKTYFSQQVEGLVNEPPIHGNSTSPIIKHLDSFSEAYLKFLSVITN